MRIIRSLDIFVIAIAATVAAIAAAAVADGTFDFCICKRIEHIVFQCFPNAGTLISFEIGNIVRLTSLTSFSMRWISSASKSSTSHGDEEFNSK